MICKVKTITHSSNALSYCEQGGELIHAHGVNGTAKDINKQFKRVHELKPNVKQKSIHAIVSLNPKDRELNRGELMEISERYAKQHGFDKNQYAVYLHKDKAHTHLHIVANRIGYDRTVVSSSHSYAKNTEFSMRMEKEYSLTQANRKVKGKDFVVKNEHSETLKSIIDECLKHSKNLEELSKNLKERYSVTMYKGRGVSFMYQEGNDKAIKTKGSAIGKEYSLKGLEKQIEQLHSPKQLKISSSLEQLINKEVSRLESQNSSKQTNISEDLGQSTGGDMSGLTSGNDMEDEPIKRKSVNVTAMTLTKKEE
nr:protein rlx-like [Lepeophtheirus salmonis]